MLWKLVGRRSSCAGRGGRAPCEARQAPKTGVVQESWEGWPAGWSNLSTRKFEARVPPAAGAICLGHCSNINTFEILSLLCPFSSQFAAHSPAREQLSTLLLPVSLCSHSTTRPFSGD